MNRKKSALFLIILASVLSCNNGEEYRSYIPTYNNEGRFYTSEDSLTRKHLLNIRKVFLHYDIPFKVEGNKISYKGDLSPEFLWNLTSKANDTAWLNSNH